MSKMIKIFNIMIIKMYLCQISVLMREKAISNVQAPLRSLHYADSCPKSHMGKPKVNVKGKL